MFFLPLLLLLQNLQGLASGKELKRCGQNICTSKIPIYRIRKDPQHYSEAVHWSERLPSFSHILWFQARTVAALSGSGNFKQIFQTLTRNIQNIVIPLLLKATMCEQNFAYSTKASVP
jgi:hypothetical protein